MINYFTQVRKGFTLFQFIFSGYFNYDVFPQFTFYPSAAIDSIPPLLPFNCYQFNMNEQLTRIAAPPLELLTRYGDIPRRSFLSAWITAAPVSSEADFSLTPPLIPIRYESMINHDINPSTQAINTIQWYVIR